MNSRKPKNHFGVLLYDQKYLPRYYELSKRLVKSLFVIPSFVSLLCLIALLMVGIHFKNIRTLIIKKEPVIIQKLKDENSKLLKTQHELQTYTKELQNKLVSKAVSPLDTLSLFRPIPGQNDSTLSPGFSIQNEKVERNGDKIKYRFEIHNEMKEGKKLTGYLFVLFQQYGGIQIYPQDAVDSNMQLVYNRGESFTTYRFRPTETSFNYSLSSDVSYLKILVFSRTGDLLFKQIKPFHDQKTSEK